jgi:NAD(P) transhydrogenase subunit alpha
VRERAVGLGHLEQVLTLLDRGARAVRGIENLAGTVPLHASQVYSNNVVNLLSVMIAKDGTFKLDTADEIIKATLVCHQGQLVNDMVAKSLGLELAAV